MAPISERFEKARFGWNKILVFNTYDEAMRYYKGLDKGLFGGPAIGPYTRGLGINGMWILELVDFKEGNRDGAV